MKGVACLSVTVAIPVIAYIVAVILGLTASEHSLLVHTNGQGEQLAPDFRGIPVAPEGTCSYVRSKASNLWLHRRMWEPECGAEKARAVLVFAHGVMEHSGRFLEMPEPLTHAGIAVAMQDAEGHGRSEGDRIFVPHFSRLVEDYIQLIKDVRAAHPGVPVICSGHSMGSLMAGYTVEFNNTNDDGSLLCDGVILMGLATQGRSERRIREKPQGMKAFDVISQLFPHLKLAKLSTADQISSDPDEVKAWVEDPYTGKTALFTSTGDQLLHAQFDVADNAKLINIPLLLLHGSDDTIAYPDGARELFAASSTPAENKKLIIYEGARHGVLMEPKYKKQALEEIKNFVLSRVKASA